MQPGRAYTLSELARALGTEQHRLIHLCEKGVVAPELQDAHGRGSSRLFSARNYLEFAIALRLRAAMLPVAAVSSVLRVLHTFEGTLQREIPGFSLPSSLRKADAPDLRIIVSDGQTIFFSLGGSSRKPKLFGGVPLDQVAGNKPSAVRATTAAKAGLTSGNGRRGEFGGPEGSRFIRLEMSVTETARDLSLD